MTTIEDDNNRRGEKICDNCKKNGLEATMPWHRHHEKAGLWLCSTCYARVHYNLKRKFTSKDERYRYLSERFRGTGNPFFGKQHTEETKRKISEKKTGVPLPEKTRAKMIGRPVSLETRMKLSAIFKGRPSPMLGRRHTDESKMRLSIANMGRRHSEETKRKLAEIMKAKNNHPSNGREIQEAKRILSEKNKVKFAWNKGIRMSDQARRNMSIAHLGIYPSEETRKRMSIAQTGLKRKAISEIGRANMRRAQIGRKHSNETRSKMRTCSLNEAAFDIITEESAYWIGFLMADGNISYKREIPVIALYLKESDLPHLEKFRMFVGSSHKIGHYVNKIWGNTSYSLSFSSEKIANRLAEYGIVRRKCFIGKSTGLEDNRHFWRGIIDGDGHLGVYPRKTSVGTIRPIPYISVTGNLYLCNQFKSFLESALNLSMPNIVASKKSYAFSVSDHRALKAIKLLYEGCIVALERKLAIANKIMISFEVIANSRYIKRLL